MARSQSALEYMMTYGWAILIIVIVAGVLYSLGIFNPASSTGTTITGFSGLGTPVVLCTSNGLLRIQLGNNVGQTINITAINITSNGVTHTIRPNQTISPEGSYTFSVPNVCNGGSGSRYAFTSIVAYKEPGQVFQSALQSSGTLSGIISSTAQPPAVGVFNNYAHYLYAWAGSGNVWNPSEEFSYINVTQSISGTNKSYTVTMWVQDSMPYGTYPSPPNSSGVNGNWQPLSGFASTTADGQELAGTTGNMVLHRCTSADSGLGPSNPVTNFYDGHWHFIAYSVSASSYLGMVDGLTGTGSGLHQYIDQATFYIGGYGGNNACFPQPFTGYVSNVQLYNTSLSTTQLNTIYQGGIAGGPIFGSTLVAWWPLNSSYKNGTVPDYGRHLFYGQLHNASITSNYVSGPIGG